MSDESWSPEELYDSVGSRGLEAMVAVTVRKEGLTEAEARARAEEFFTTYNLDRTTGTRILSDEEARAMADELEALAARIADERKNRGTTTQKIDRGDGRNPPDAVRA